MRLPLKKIKRKIRILRFTGSGKRDSNSRPRPWQGRALPTELFPHFQTICPLATPTGHLAALRQKSCFRRFSGLHRGAKNVFLPRCKYKPFLLLTKKSKKKSGLFKSGQFLDVVQFIQGFQRGEIIDIEVFDFVADLFEHRVVELEKAELNSFAA